MYAESGIVLDVSNLTLAGTVPLQRGADGFPLDSDSQPAVAIVRKSLPVNGFMFQVRATNVSITGLVLDVLEPIPPPPQPGQGGIALYVDGALSPSDGFSIEGNIVQGEGFGQGINSRMASGTIQGNRLTSLMSGSAVFGGRPDQATSVVFGGNLVIGNTNVGAAFQGGTGSKNPPRVSSADGPGSLFVCVSDNQFRRNGSDQENFANLGLSFVVNDDSRSDTTQAARIEASVHDNYFIENRFWGVSVAQRISPNAPVVGYEFDGTFERNHYCGNGLNEAIFDFRQVTTTLGGGTQQFRYGRGSTYVIHAENDPLASIVYDRDHPANDPDSHTNEPPGTQLWNTLMFNGSTVATAPLPVLQRTMPVVGCYFLRGNGPDANPSDLFLGSARTASTSRYRDSAGVKFAAGNVLQEIGTWTATPAPGSLNSGGNLQTWIGLKNSDDLQTRFDLQAKLYKNGVLFATGLTRCIQGVTKDPNSAEAVTVVFGPFPTEVFTGSDVLDLKVLTRIGTNPDGSQCAGHTNATGLRLYFDSTNRPSGFDSNP